MSISLANFTLDLVVVILLVLCIGYCSALNRRIKILQDSKSELAQLLRHFDESTQRASESIIALQTASKKIGENIQFRIDKANYLLEDLGFMIEKGNKLADQMEASFAVNRARTRAMSEPQPVEAPAAQPARPQPVMEAAPEKPFEKISEKPPERSASNRERTTASLEAVLERVVGRKAANSNPEAEESRSARPRAETPRPRSRAEQELLDMIKAGVKG